MCMQACTHILISAYTILEKLLSIKCMFQIIPVAIIQNTNFS